MAARKREEGNKERNYMEDGYGGSKYRCNKCHFVTVPPQAMKKGQRKVCKLCLFAMSYCNQLTMQ